VDFLLRAHCDTAAAKAFFRKAIRQRGLPPKTVTFDGCAGSRRAVREMKEDGELSADTKVRCSKYLNNVIEVRHEVAYRSCSHFSPHRRGFVRMGGSSRAVDATIHF
jgi:transposase-like protein